MPVYFLDVIVCYPGVEGTVVSSLSRLLLGIQTHGKIIAWQLKVKHFIFCLKGTVPQVKHFIFCLKCWMVTSKISFRPNILTLLVFFKNLRIWFYNVLIWHSTYGVCIFFSEFLGVINLIKSWYVCNRTGIWFFFTTLTFIVLPLCHFFIENFRIRFLVWGFDCDDFHWSWMV